MTRYIANAHRADGSVIATRTCGSLTSKQDALQNAFRHAQGVAQGSETDRAVMAARAFIRAAYWTAHKAA